MKKPIRSGSPNDIRNKEDISKNDQKSPLYLLKLLSHLSILTMKITSQILFADSLCSMAVLSSWAHEQRSREKNKNQVAPAPISSRFLCPRPPLLLSVPNQNRHATQANLQKAGLFLKKAQMVTGD